MPYAPKNQSICQLLLSKDEVSRLISGMQGLHQLMAKLLYGCRLHPLDE
jgi:hypothetical protein